MAGRLFFPDPTGKERRQELFRRPTVMTSAVVLLLLMTVGLFELAPRYEPTGPALLRNGGFKEGLKEWTVHGAKGTATVSSGVVVLESRDPSRSVGIRQELPAIPGQQTLMLEVEASTEGVRQGAKSWHDARIYIVGRTAEGKSLWETHRIATHLIGDNAWRRYSGAFPVTENVKEVMVAAQLSRTTGIMKLRNLRLYPVKERATFRVAVYVLLAAWAVTLAGIGGYLLCDIGSTPVRGLVAVVTLGIVAGALIPGPLKQELLTSVWREYEHLLQAMAGYSPEISGLNWSGPEYLYLNTSQIAHFALFFALAGLVYFAWRAGGRAFQLLSLLLFGAVTEALQYFVSGRQATVQDWLFDAGGILLAFALLSIFGIRRNVPAAGQKGLRR